MKILQLLLVAFMSISASAGIHVSAGFCGGSRHIESVDEYGHALGLYRLGEFDLANKKIPLYAYWSSEDDATKSHLGHGWHVPWFECRMIPVDESTYELRSMFGERLRFRKDPKDTKLYRHGKNVCATASKDVVKVYLRSTPVSAPDLVFVGGRLDQFAYDSKSFRIAYEKGCFSKMTCGGRTVLSVERAAQDSRRIEIFFNGKRDRPARVWTGRTTVCTGFKAGSPVMSERSTVVAMQTAEEERYDFSYGMKGVWGRMFDGRTEITWDPATRSIVTHGDWTYDISGHDPDRGIWRLRRRSAGGEENEYSYDARTGMQVKIYKGVKEIARLFTSGKLRGMMRWYETHVPGSYAERTECTYDENKCLIYFKRINLLDNTYSENWMNSNGKLEKVRYNGDYKTTQKFVYASDGSRTVVRETDNAASKGKTGK